MPNTHDTMTQPNPEQSGEIDGDGLSAELVAAARLAIVSGKNAGQVFTLYGRESLIGRISGARVRLDDKAISTRHAKLTHEDQRLWITDLGSTNGTLLNGERLLANQPVELHPGDNIQIGETVMAYVGDGVTEQTQALAPLAVRGAGTASMPLPTDAQTLVQLLQTVSMQPEPEAPKVTLEDYINKALRILAVLKRNWLPLFAATALCALLGNASVFVAPPPSEAVVRLRLTPKPASEDVFQRGQESREERERFFQTAEQNFMSRSLVEKTLISLGIKQPSKTLVTTTLARLQLEGIVKGTYEGTFTDTEPERAVRYLATHVNNYLGTEVDKHIHVIQAEVDFLEKSLKENETQLLQTENELKTFKDEHLDGLPEFATEQVGSREQLLAQRAAASAAASRAALEYNLAKKRLAEEAPLLSRRVDQAAPYRTALTDTNRKLGEARAKGLGDQHPEVVALKKNAAELQRQIEQASNTKASEVERNADLIPLRNRVGELEVAAKAAGAELGAINQLLARSDKIVNKMPEVESRYAQLTRNYESAKAHHTRLFDKLRTSQLQLDLERTSAKARYEILNPPESSGVPVKKALVKRTLLGALGGLGIGIMIAALLELKRYLRARRKSGSTAIVPAAG